MPETTRQQFQDELEQLERQALGGLDMVCQALDRAIEVVQHQDVELASMVIADDDRIDGRYLEVHQGILSLLALQAPVAGDLRLVAALLHVIKHVERMGDQCVNMAKLVPLAGHEPPADAEMLEKIARMGELARSLTQQCKLAFERRDAALAQDLVRQDDGIDKLNRECFRRALEIGDDADQREWAMHMMLIARCLERIGDNAVDIGEQTAFVVTGLFREFEDASHPELTPGRQQLMGAPLFASAPNRGKFEALFEEGGRNLEAVTGLMERLMRGWPDEPELRDEIKALEERGDRITHDILHALYSTTVTPLDREDIHSLASALDDAVDYTEEAADVLGLYKIEAPMEQGVELAGVLRDCGRELAAALTNLTALDSLAPHVAAVDRLEDEGDRISRKAIVALFAGGIDPMVVIRWKDVIERLEQAVDSCDKVAHVLEGIAVKHN